MGLNILLVLSFFLLFLIYLSLFLLFHFYPFWFIIPVSKIKIFKEIPQPLIIIKKSGKVLFINKEAERLTGYNLKKMKEFNIENLITMPTALDILSKCVSSETKSFSSETSLQSKTGESIPVLLKASIIPDLIFKNRIVGIMLSFTDLSFEKNAIEKLKKTEQLEVLGLLAGG
ncbi:MAG: PAS domain-containing protein, partial [Chitinispirillaceae bacterium]|nr:PAS domain-containing protein [Chitinispirillaceae bacterium]